MQAKGKCKQLWGLQPFHVIPFIPVLWLLSSVEPFWKLQGTCIPGFVPAAAANNSWLLLQRLVGLREGGGGASGAAPCGVSGDHAPADCRPSCLPLCCPRRNRGHP